MPHLVVYEYTLEYAPARHPRRHDAVELRAERRERVRQHLPRLRQPLLPLRRVGHRTIAVTVAALHIPTTLADAEGGSDGVELRAR